MAKVRITVAKRAVHHDLIDRHLNRTRYPQPETFGACTAFQDGQTFLLDGFPVKPEGFPCDWAWSDIQRDVAMIAFGAGAPWIEQPGAMVTCCTDGLRPVSFLVERVEE